jgi:Flp pilus assembly protein TadG
MTHTSTRHRQHRAELPAKRGVLRRLLRGRRGQSLVEFSLVLPVLLIIVFGIVDFGMGLRSYISLTNATREGARFAAVGNPAGSFPSQCNGTTTTTVVGRTCVAVEGLKRSDITSLTVAYPNGQGPGNSVIVSANYTYHYITPLGDIIHFFSGGTLTKTIALSTSTDMRLE